MRPLIFVVLFVVVAGCASSRHLMMADNDSSVRPVNASEVPGPSHLTTKEVLASAYACASSHRVDTNRFKCRSIRFAGGDPKQKLVNKWILHFAPDSMSLHEDLFIDVDDLNGEAELVRH